MTCEYEENTFCTAFICYSKEKNCNAKSRDGKPMYSTFKSMDDIKYDTTIDERNYEDF